MTFSVLTPEEVRWKYEKAAEDEKGHMIGVLAGLTACSEMEVLEFLGVGGCAPAGKSSVIDHDRALQLYKEGKSDYKIAKLMGVGRKTVWAWRNRNGLPFHPAERKKAHA